MKNDVAADTWQIFQLSVIDGFPIEEVAKRLNKSVGAAYAARGRVMNRHGRIVNESQRSEL